MLTHVNRISEGAYYEAHQQLRTISARYVKSADYDSAIDLLHQGALALLKAGQGGSGGDLAVQLVDVLEKRGGGVSATDKSKLLGILRAFPPDEPTKKKYVQSMIQWSAKDGDFPMGDPELHHGIGVIYAEGTLSYRESSVLLSGRLLPG